MPCGGFGERVVNTMAESKNYIVQPQEGGNILISEDVIASIASPVSVRRSRVSMA